MNNPKVERIVRRGLVDLGLAAAILAGAAALFALDVSAGSEVARLWAAFVFWTAILCWVAVKRLRMYWRNMTFWFGLTGLLIIHLSIFIPVLRSVSEIHPVWFIPVVIVEGGLWVGVLKGLVIFWAKRGTSNPAGR